ncbi:MAG: NUDIX domain-containing protein [Gemmataceae bacterium]
MHIHKIEQLTHEKWLNLFAADFEHNGHAGRWLYASRKPQPSADRGADAVIIVPILRSANEPPRLVMVKEFRVPIGDYVFAFPAGLIDAGESIEDTARRELREETGLEVVAVQRVSQPLYSSSGLTDEAVAMAFVDARRTPETLPKLDALEDLEVLLLDFAGVCRLCDDRAARIDARAWAILYGYQQLGTLP